MDAAQLLIVVVGTVASLFTFGLMRFPHLRRAPFRRYQACSLLQSILGAGVVFLLTILLVMVQGAG